MAFFGFGKKKPAPVEDAVVVEDEIVADGEVSVLADVAAEDSTPAQKKRGEWVTNFGKGIILANCVIAILFISTAVFFHANKLDVNDKRAKLDQANRELTTLQGERQTIVDGLNQEIEAENARIAEAVQTHQKQLGDLETSIRETRQRVDQSRTEQVKLSDQTSKLHQEQEELLAEIVQLRDTLETTRGDEEALTADRDYVADQLAKVTNNLREAERRQKELRQRLDVRPTSR